MAEYRTFGYLKHPEVDDWENGCEDVDFYKIDKNILPGMATT